jgi:4-hydroxy 2-oxovalerate aldolase
MGNNTISILECTLRDGGLALEDEAKYDKDVRRFDAGEASQIARHLALSFADFIELGSIELSDSDKTGYAIYNSISDISCIRPEIGSMSRFAALFRGPDTPLEQIPEYNTTHCECIRVIIRYSELVKSMDFCAGLSHKGYKVFVQPMVTLRYTQEEINYVIKASNDLNAFALYFVDSYGYMNEDHVKRLFDNYDNLLDPSIHIGFHSHNNMNLAFSNVIKFIEHSQKCNGERNIIIDSTCLGMGQGAGNLQTELLVSYLNDNYDTDYDYSAILDACEIVETHTPQSVWGYSVPRMLSATSKVAYKYAIALRRKYGLKYKEINHIFRNIPEELRHRYTPENTIELLKLFGYKEIV